MNRYEIRDGQLVPLQDHYVEVDLEDDFETATDSNTLLALRLPNDIDPEDVAGRLDHITAIIVEFPKFADGRAYSQARILRDQYQFRGKIIARGDVLPDQIFFMVRCGIDSVELASNNIDVYQRALGTFSHVYQRGSDTIEPVFAKRQNYPLRVD